MSITQLNPTMALVGLDAMPFLLANKPETEIVTETKKAVTGCAHIHLITYLSSKYPSPEPQKQSSSGFSKLNLIWNLNPIIPTLPHRSCRV